MKILENISLDEALKVCERPVFSNDEIIPVIQEVFDRVRSSGDKALFDYTEQFDQVVIDNLLVSDKEMSAAQDLLDIKVVEAINAAATNIEKFHAAQRFNLPKVETQEGVPRVTEHHDKGHEGPLRAPDTKRSEVTPIDLRLFARQGAQT